MDESTVADTFHEFRQEVLAAAFANQDFALTEFLHAYGRELEQCDEIDELNTCNAPNVRGMRIDGYGYNLDDGLDLFIADFEQRRELETLTRTDVATLVRRLTNFFFRSLEGPLYRTLEETSEVYAVSRAIHERGKEFGRIRLFVLSERQLSDRYEAVDLSLDTQGVPVALHIWDMSRLHRLRSSRGTKEPIEIDVVKICGAPLPCLSANLGENSYRSFLLAIPGGTLADLYAKFGAKLLEQNVRAFLQTGNKANRGIRQTILTDPGMFFAYNNGVTATASSVTMVEGATPAAIASIKDLQIVNGGQTTASLFHARRKDKANLSEVFVPMKLTIIDDERIDEVVPNISQFANTQNAVNAADFFANHPFHLKMEQYSRRLWAPVSEGGHAETHWYYERTRGQFSEEQSRLDSRAKKIFLEQNPKAQLIKKTDLAKVDNVWDDDPVQVNLGAQKNFARYAVRIGQSWKDNPERFDENYFRQAVARTILFRDAERIVALQSWYAGGYRANIVAYTMAMIASALAAEKRTLDVQKIWSRQATPLELVNVIADVAAVVNQELTGPGRGLGNVTEWAKKPQCWLGILTQLPRARSAVTASAGAWSEVIP